MSGARCFARDSLAAALVVAAVAPFLVFALVSLGHGWFYPAPWPAALDTDSWRALLGGGRRLVRASVTSIALGVGTGVLGTALGLVVGRALAGLRGWQRYLGAAAAFLPVAAPPIAVATGLHLSFLSLGLAGSFAGVLLAHLVPAAGYLALYFLGIFSVWDTRVEEEARSLGASPLQVLLHVTLPLLRPALATSVALGFLISWAQVPLTLLIGGGLVPTLPVETFAYVTAGQDRFAATGALLLVVPPLLLMAALRLVVRQTEVAPV
jgi:putative spermidine/putrescine transport system permease protein